MYFHLCIKNQQLPFQKIQVDFLLASIDVTKKNLVRDFKGNFLCSYLIFHIVMFYFKTA